MITFIQSKEKQKKAFSCRYIVAIARQSMGNHENDFHYHPIKFNILLNVLINRLLLIIFILK